MEKMKWVIGSILAIGFLCSSFLAYSQEVGIEELEKIYGEEVVVSATKFETSLLEAPAWVDVITKKEIRRLDPINFPEVFKFLSGIDMYQKTWTDQDVGIRGTAYDEAAKTLILCNGHPVYSPYHYGIDWPDVPLNIENIERIEVAKGPLSALYGANAFAGVINIISTPVSERKNLIVAKYGEEGYYYTVLRPVIHYDKLHTSFLLRRRRTEKRGEFDHSDYNSMNDWRWFDYDEKNLGLVDLEYDFSQDSKLYFSFGFQKGKGAYNSSPDNPKGIRRYNPKEDTLVRARIENPFLEDGKIETRFTLNRHRRINYQEDWNHIYEIDVKYRDLDVNAFKPFEFFGKHRLNVNVGLFDLEQYADFYIAQADRTFTDGRWSLALSEECRPVEELILSVGIRYDNWRSTEHDQISWRVAPVYLLSEDLAIRFSAGKAYRQPNIGELYYFQPAAKFSGDPNLRPEISEEYELGIKKLWGKNTSLEAAIFYRDAQDLIGYAYADDFPSYFPSKSNYGITGQIIHFANVGNIIMHGGELSLKHTFSEEFSSSLNYTLQDFEEACGQPRNKFNIGIDWSPKDLFILTLRGHYSSKSKGWTSWQPELKSYTVFDMSLQKDFVLADGNLLTLALSGYNILDEGHYEYPGMSYLGRKLWLTARYTF